MNSLRPSYQNAGAALNRLRNSSNEIVDACRLASALEGCAPQPRKTLPWPRSTWISESSATCGWKYSVHCATVNSISESLVILEPGSGVCAVTAPLGHCGEGTSVVLASFSPVEVKRWSASGSERPTTHGMT